MAARYRISTGMMNKTESLAVFGRERTFQLPTKSNSYSALDFMADIIITLVNAGCQAEETIYNLEVITANSDMKAKT